MTTVTSKARQLSTSMSPLPLSSFVRTILELMCCKWHIHMVDEDELACFSVKRKEGNPFVVLSHWILRLYLQETLVFIFLMHKIQAFSKHVK